MPSGHTTMAFALATALSDDIHRTWASVGLYTMATGVAWSRLNDNRHWLSDVAGGRSRGCYFRKAGQRPLAHLQSPPAAVSARTEQRDGSMGA